MLKVISDLYFESERALFGLEHARLKNCSFDKGESPLKHAKNIVLTGTSFAYKYPLWYAKDIEAEHICLLENARSGLWYIENLSLKNSFIAAPKSFRKASKIKLFNVDMPNALESFWDCKDVNLQKVSVRGDYFAFHSENLRLEDFNIQGNYCFDSCKNVYIKNAKILSKDAFWNCENVELEDSFISGEYLAWNSKNITFKNCTIESLQGLCYIENLKLENCKLINTSLAFEYSSVKASINSNIKSIINPLEAEISAFDIDELILDQNKVDTSKTHITLLHKEGIKKEHAI
ncbi:DUF3737 domain-containing protein [Campylobacter sp. MIT 12-8780]|uniref:DUF3737 family protein n=1 Tax=unclassified Campylobacter TaxID=2593542 RepID=UPI00115EB3B5|nr:MULTISPECIES: DUF3737 family protein [unclassified Campylobacter]NDJ27118.1 DUF3737 family protein [Campylobacter sp. MIT 19-121]TQR41584.1 DUF3737 domain-containing protein [Campylobacter sp. MIT 12-8780]